MLTKDFDFDLPKNLIAQEPSGVRGEDRLLVLNSKTGEFIDKNFSDFPELIPNDALLVFNNSRVRKARTFAKKENTGANVEFLFLEDFYEGCVWKVLAKRGKRQNIGDTYIFPDGTRCKIIAPKRISESVFQNELLQTQFQETKKTTSDNSSEKFLQFEKVLTDKWFETNGRIPLPPYIKRDDNENDASRYQNVYATEVGSVACPTAGLHFTKELLSKLEAKKIQTLTLTLHVGLGTFLPVRAEKLEDHKMHFENFFISDEVATKIEKHKAEGKPILAVGTTSLRALEGAALAGEKCKLKRGWQSSNIFIYPPYEFKLVDQLLTNFHTPRSTLLMLVSALAGRENILRAYKHAVAEKYRFFSYGDAMLIL
ncbi:MAG: tRNA preQ1(34) S-adenosylmethionine ribosyltransferase-isomerase QueA [Treponemataceae bacterium]